MDKINLSINCKIINKGDARKQGWINTSFTLSEFIAHIQKGFAYSSVMTDPKLMKKPKIADISHTHLLSLDIDNTFRTYDGKEQSERKRHINEGYFDFVSAKEDPWLNKHASFIYTTPSHTAEHHKFRIVFVLEEPIADHREYTRIANDFISFFRADHMCKNIDRMFFGNSNAEVHIFGETLTLREIDNTRRAYQEKLKSVNTYNDNFSKEITEDQVAKMLDCIPAKMDYNTWLGVLSGIANHFDKSTAVRLIENWSPDETIGTSRKVDYALKDYNIGTVIYHAQQNGFNVKTLSNGNGNTASYEPVNRSSGFHGKPLPEEPSQSTISEAGVLTLTEDDLAHMQTELANSDKFVEQFGDEIKFNYTSGRWHLWDGKKWAEDEKDAVMHLIRNTIDRLNEELPNINGEKNKKSYMAFVKTSSTLKHMRAVLSLASSRKNIAIINQDFDRDPYIINLKNGIFNLKTDKFTEHNPDALLSKMINVDYDPEAQCPRFEKALDLMFDSNVELQKFVQRAVGLSLCGAHLEEVLFFCYGTGKNGKSVFFTVLQRVFGDYFKKAPTEMLMQRFGDNIPNDIAQLPGRRLAVTAEMPEGRAFNENKLKDLTGGDSMTARFLNKEFFEFKPTHTLWVYGNHKPNIKGTDEGIWRRINMVPFTKAIPEKERISQHELMEGFEKEVSGILNWVINGWRGYLKERLSPPGIVKLATEEYQTEQDRIGDFINDCIEINGIAREKTKKVWNVYVEWCNSMSEKPLGRNKFLQEMQRKEGIEKENKNGNNWFLGIKIIDKNAEENGDENYNNRYK
jgi:P4 family phage/plasmid primase-like protien